MNVGSGSTASVGDEMLDAAQTLVNLNAISPGGVGGGPPSTISAPPFKPPIGVPSSSRRGRGGRGASSRGGGRGRGRGRLKGSAGETGGSGGEVNPIQEDSEEGDDASSISGSSSSGIITGARTIAIGDKVYPESFFDEILNLRKLELLQDPEILTLLKKVQRKNSPP